MRAADEKLIINKLGPNKNRFCKINELELSVIVAAILCGYWIMHLCLPIIFIVFYAQYVAHYWLQWISQHKPHASCDDI